MLPSANPLSSFLWDYRATLTRCLIIAMMECWCQVSCAKGPHHQLVTLTGRNGSWVGPGPVPWTKYRKNKSHKICWQQIQDNGFVVIPWVLDKRRLIVNQNVLCMIGMMLQSFSNIFPLGGSNNSAQDCEFVLFSRKMWIMRENVLGIKGIVWNICPCNRHTRSLTYRAISICRRCLMFSCYQKEMSFKKSLWHKTH